MRRTIIFPVIALVGIPALLNAQCSDAGVCSIGHPTQAAPHGASVSYGFGKSGKIDSLTFHSVEAAGSFEVIEGGRITVSLPFNSQSGPMGSVSGIGDLTLLWRQTIFSGNGSTIALQAGAKIAFADVNTGNLPQSYQSGLGTNDLLVGLRYDASEWNFALAYQLSGGRSENTTTRLKRGDDLLLRAGYSPKVGEVQLTGEILAIKRMHKSSVLTSVPGQPEAYGDLPGSDQAQINLLARGSYPVSDAVKFGLMAAVPLLQRDVNVDGLTRSIALSAGFTFSL